jgi:hypothetical protein
LTLDDFINTIAVNNQLKYMAGNPNPNPNNLKPIPRQDDSTETLATLATSARLPLEIDAVVRSLPNRSAWLRRVVTEAAKRELINQ